MNIIWIILSFVLGELICGATFLFCAGVDYLKYLEKEEREQDDERTDE